jgi:hypothetical protein
MQKKLNDIKIEIVTARSKLKEGASILMIHGGPIAILKTIVYQNLRQKFPKLPDSMFYLIGTNSKNLMSFVLKNRE